MLPFRLTSAVLRSSLRAIESYFSDPAEYDAHIKDVASIDNGWVPLTHIVRLPRVRHALSVVSSYILYLDVFQDDCVN